ncbi:N-acetyltransferase [Azospirillum sp. RWY-5-1]|uniref:N-acetyltransferase n=1 Tax=Azospirillum oleiclasticum TaxID=2735135 RepID=A0ABX2TKA8_9PROT|nr:GNAT family N-acetyltransferase [Azospirillum oleiclasticum]NYZ17340.1 N-acetyltransferase [Azospirillum oleiclasticum]NYZ24718.1 N-acetyltransferase [Azospirillum oleiclasticum]
MDPVIRISTPDDLPAIQAIYAHHVLHGIASFEEVPPDTAELGRRRADVLARGLPHLVAVRDGAVIGFAYAGPYRTRPAYRHTVEDSVYVAQGLAGGGVGRALLERVVALCEVAGCRQMVAVIGDSGNAGSIRLHEALGFTRVGLLPSVGFKLGRWVDSVLMQRALGPGDTTPPRPESA